MIVTLSGELDAGRSVTLTYTPPDTDALSGPDGHEVPGSSLTVLNRPAAPAVTLTPGDTQITASWAEPADGNSTITSYVVQHKPAGALDTDYATVSRSDDAALTETITGLLNDTQYTVRVAAVNGVGTGPWSDAVSATPSEVVRAPGGPHLVWGNARVIVRWIPPADIAGDDSVEGWLIQWRQSGGAQEWSTDRQSSVEKLHDDDGDGTDDWLSFEKLVTGLTNDTEHEFRVRARVQGGRAAEWTDAAATTPKHVTPDVPALTAADLQLVDRDKEGPGTPALRVMVDYYDEPVRSVTAEGLAEYTVRRTFHLAGHVSDPAYPLTEVRIGLGPYRGNSIPVRTITTLHLGTGPDDWGGFDYPPSYIDIPSSLFLHRYEVTGLDGSTANNNVHDGGSEGVTGARPMPSVDQEKAVLGAPVGVDGGLEIAWQDHLWAGTAAYHYQLCVQWKSGDEEFYAGEDLAVTGIEGIGDRAVILTGEALTAALIAGSYTLTGLDIGTAYDVRVAYCDDGGDPRVDPDLISNVVSGTPVDLTAPEVVSAEVVEDGAKIEIVFDEPLDTGSVPPPSAFAVTVDGAAAVTPSSVDITAATVVLSMPAGDAIAAGATVTVAYTEPNADPLQDLATTPNQVGSFAGRAVLNRPAAPTGLTLTPGDVQIEASWTAPTANGGSTITSYEVQHKPASAPDADYATVSRSDADARHRDHHQPDQRHRIHRARPRRQRRRRRPVERRDVGHPRGAADAGERAGGRRRPDRHRAGLRQGPRYGPGPGCVGFHRLRDVPGGSRDAVDGAERGDQPGRRHHGDADHGRRAHRRVRSQSELHASCQRWAPERHRPRGAGAHRHRAQPARRARRDADARRHADHR